jgi:4-amino-4-deoxychorismate lyase
MSAHTALNKPDGEPKDFHLFTSLRYDTILLKSSENQSLCFTTDSPLYMVTYHRDRILEAAHHFEFKSNIGLLEDGEGFQKEIVGAAEAYMKGKNIEDTPLRV